MFVQAWRNRISPNLYKVFSDLLGTKKLIASMDRLGIMRPTKNIRFPKKDKKGNPIEGEFEVCDKPEWLTQSQWYCKQPSHPTGGKLLTHI